MNILQIANGYCGNCLYKELFQQQRTLDINLEVFVPLHKGTAIPEEEPADVVFDACFGTLDRILFRSKQKNMLCAIERHWDVRQFQAIHAHTLFSGGYSAWKLHQKYGLPYVVAVRNTDKNVFFRYMLHLRHVGVKILRDAAAVVFLSPAYRDAVIETYVPASLRKSILEKSVVLPNGISSVFMDDRCPPHQLSADGVRLIYVGEITENKNISTTVDAVERLRSEGVSIMLTVAGPIRDPQYDGYFAKYPFVTYLGKLTPEQVKVALRQSDLFVMPSHKETFGLVYAEAMSQGLPVLYTRGEGFDGQFPDGQVGYAVDDHDSRDVAEKIKAVMANYDAMAWQAYEGCVRFSWPHLAEQYRDLYQKIILTEQEKHRVLE